MDTLDRGPGQLEGEVVTGGDAAPDHLGCGQGRAEILVVCRTRADGGRRPVQKNLQWHPVIDQTAGQRAMRVGVRVDEARHQQAVGGIDRFRIVGRGETRFVDRRDAAVDDQNVAFGRLPAGDVEQASTADNFRAWFGHWPDSPPRER